MKCWRYEGKIGAAAWIGAVLATICIDPARAAAQDAEQDRRMTPVVQVFREANPAVVNLSTTMIVTRSDPVGIDSIFEEFFDVPGLRRPRQYEAHSVGSGVLIQENGYLVTNAHVVDRASEIKVRFADGAELPGDLVAVDKQNDLAVLRVRAEKPLPHVRLGRSDDLMPGETVIAIGNPLGYEHTVTTGVVSAVNRELRFENNRVYSGLIQTDASINPGNSGGPLLNVLGEMIGINTAIRGDAQNIGFAIPVDRLHAILPSLLDVERVRRVHLGMHFDGRLKRPTETGVRIDRVDGESSAQKAGLRAGDVVTGIGGKPVAGFIDAFAYLNEAAVGDVFEVQYRRDGMAKGTAKLALSEPPKTDSAKMLASRFGLSVREMTADDLKQLGIRRPIGLVITGVERRSEAQRQGIGVDDVLTSFGGWPVGTMEGMGPLLEQVNEGNVIPMRVLRIGGDAFVRFELALKAR